jgi:hypothetical protein
MSGKDELLRNAERRGVLRPLKILIRGTEELTDWKPDVGKNADRISYKHRPSNRVMVRYGGLSSSWRVLDADVSQRNNQFGSVFGIDQDAVYDRLKQYLDHACKGYGTRGADYVTIRDQTDAEHFLDFLRSFLEDDAI